MSPYSNSDAEFIQTRVRGGASAESLSGVPGRRMGRSGGVSALFSFDSWPSRREVRSRVAQRDYYYFAQPPSQDRGHPETDWVQTAQLTSANASASRDSASPVGAGPKCSDGSLRILPVPVSAAEKDYGVVVREDSAICGGTRVTVEVHVPQIISAIMRTLPSDGR